MLVISIIYIIAKIILYIFLVLLLILLAVLLIPFKYYARGEAGENKSFEAYVSWFFGGLKMRFVYSSQSGIAIFMNLFGFKKKMDGGNRKQYEKNNEKHTGKKKTKDYYSYVTYPVIRKGIQSVMKLLNYCKPRQLEVNAKVGFEDPMYTGLLCGIQGAGFAILDKFNIRLQPAFEEEGVKGSLVIGGSIQIFYLLLVVMEFVFTRPFRNILLKNIKSKIKRRMRTWRISILKRA